MSKKPQMSQEERLELAAKLDKDLESFIDELPRNRGKTPSVLGERWENELEKHPFFMKEAPEPGDELHPLYEGLQKLKYDPEYNEPEELALSYKEDGTFNFKHKNYRMAIVAYTEGIKQKCDNAELNAVLYNNRAASHFFLKNYRSAFEDCQSALKLKPDYPKAMIRAANCAYHLGRYGLAVEYCDKILETDKTNKEILKLRKDCVVLAKKKDRDERKLRMAEKKAEAEEEKILSEIGKRGIHIEGNKGHLNLSRLEPQFPQLFNSRVHLEDGALIWPAILFYPEYKIMDYIQNFDENTRFADQLSQVFHTPPEWDTAHAYTAETVNVYYENPQRKIIHISPDLTLLQVLQRSDYIIKEGTPKFVVLVKDSRVEKNFLQSY